MGGTPEASIKKNTKNHSLLGTPIYGNPHKPSDNQTWLAGKPPELHGGFQLGHSSMMDFPASHVRPPEGNCQQKNTIVGCYTIVS